MARRLQRCYDCKAPIVWFRSPTSANFRKFETKPVDGRRHNGPPAFPVEGRRAWRLADLVEDLRVRRETSVEAATEEAYDMPWYVPHDCPESPFRRAQNQEDQP